MDILTSIDAWEKKFIAIGLKQDTIDRHLNYIGPLLENNVPVIFDFKHLCQLLGRKTDFLAGTINSPLNHYYTFEIPKKKGGTRSINAPYPILLESQRWIYKNILTKIKIHKTAHGFQFNKSIISNAKIHLNAKCILKIDIKNFFPSIEINRVIYVFKRLGYTHKVSFYLAALCCLDGKLPQGAPTSPMLSNIVCQTLDKRLFSLARKLNFKYTRYADDLTFSGEDISKEFINYVKLIVEQNGFEINNEKTQLIRNGTRRIVTGISVVGKTTKIPRKYKRDLVQELYYIQRFGIVSRVSKLKILKINYLKSLQGKVNFWISVEPNNNKALEYKKMLHEIEKTLKVL